MKLSPNVTDIAEMARAAEAGGADVVSLINTITGMKIDINRRTFALANKTGGMSGPAVKPVAVRMVYQVANAVKIPVIGMGGIASGRGCPGVYYGRCNRSICGNCQLHQPIYYDPGGRRRHARHSWRNRRVEDINELIGCVK